MSTVDIVDELVGASDELRALRARRPITVEQLQASFDALFSPVSSAHVSLTERDYIAAFATRLTSDDAVAEFYAERALARDAQRGSDVLAYAAEYATAGPFGHYREVGLQQENTDGKRLTPNDDDIAQFGERLAAALAHTHLLVLRPREADDAAIAALLAAGWSADGVVTLSQLVAFLAFQQRVIAGLRAIQEELA